MALVFSLDSVFEKQLIVFLIFVRIKNTSNWPQNVINPISDDIKKLNQDINECKIIDQKLINKCNDNKRSKIE